MGLVVLLAVVLVSGETVSRTLMVLLPQYGTTTDLPMDSYMV